MKEIEDLENRLKQFLEANEIYRQSGVKADWYKIEVQDETFNMILDIIKTIKKTGKINRGNEFFPDPLNAMVSKNKWSTDL